VDEKWLKNEEKGWTEWWGLSKLDLVGTTTDYNVINHVFTFHASRWLMLREFESINNYHAGS
jgi:hypothetical protein